jgi:hypothetical protein
MHFLLKMDLNKTLYPKLQLNILLQGTIRRVQSNWRLEYNKTHQLQMTLINLDENKTL